MAKSSRPCQRCGNPIPSDRLDALPETRLCVQCSSEVGGEFNLKIQSENLSKTGSLKKNYGGWTISRKRKPILTLEEEEKRREEMK